MAKTRLLLDRKGLNALMYRTATHVDHDQRTYYTGRRPFRAVVVFRAGLDAHTLVGQVVDAQIGVDQGFVGFVREGNEGRSHTKVTIYRALAGAQAERRLSEVLTSGFKDQ